MISLINTFCRYYGWVIDLSKDPESQSLYDIRYAHYGYVLFLVGCIFIYPISAVVSKSAPIDPKSEAVNEKSCALKNSMNTLR
ncbi:MAG: hypothetical protein AAF519_02025 [Bacteroidota bacterium]